MTTKWIGKSFSLEILVLGHGVCLGGTLAMTTSLSKRESIDRGGSNE